MRILFLALMLATSAVVGSAEAQQKLTVYTYESFTAEWGPGPQVEKAFEAECGCDLQFVSVADGVALLNRVRLEGASTKADVVLGLDTNLTAEAKATGLFAPAGIDLAGVKVPGGWTDDMFVPFDYAHFAVVYDTEKLKNPPKSLKDLVEGNPEEKIVLQDPRTSTPGLGLVLWVKAVYGDKAPEAWAKLKNRVLTVTPGWSEAYGLFTKGEAPMVFSYTTSPAYHMVAEGHRKIPGGGLRGRPLSADRSGRHHHDRREKSAGEKIPRLHDRPGLSGRDTRNQLDVPRRQNRQAAQPRLRKTGAAGKDADLQSGRSRAEPQGLGRRMAGGDEQIAKRTRRRPHTPRRRTSPPQGGRLAAGAAFVNLGRCEVGAEGEAADLPP